MAEKKIIWTDQQRQAIAERGKDILVTASAGTGKTAVLSGRCADIVSDPSICPDVWSILVVTFTDAAAEEMRVRIAGQLRDALAQTKNPHLARQLVLLQASDISTIHSFCKRLITENFYKLGLDPAFNVIAGDEQKLLKAEMLEKTIEWAWRQDSLRQGLEQLLGRRNLNVKEGFCAKVIEISNFLDTIAYRQRWFDKTGAFADAVNLFGTKAGKKQKEIILETLTGILDQLGHAQRLYESRGCGGDWACKLEDTHVQPLKLLVEFLQSNECAKWAEAIRDFKKPRTNTPKDIEKPIADFIAKAVRKALSRLDSLFGLAVLNPGYYERIGRSSSLQTKILIELVKRFDHFYSHAKSQINCLDFADLEHYALKLLSDEDCSEEDKPEPSETALALGQKYKYIFVDEYQDINAVQQAILDCLSNDGNLFVVGDVKQSIYAFRGASPDIFLERLGDASADSQNAANGLRVDLTENFRSNKGILEFVNKLFSRIMTASVSKLDYDESAMLKAASATESENTSGQVVELHILDEQQKGSESENQDGTEIDELKTLGVVSPRQRQAMMIARRIKEMVGGDTGKAEFEIFDKQLQKKRPVDYRDIVILMRSPANKAEDYVEVLQLAGVPVSCKDATGFFEATEITDLLCLLKVLDNPRRDVELAALLRSPVFDFSDTELARIRVESKSETIGGDFYDCMVEYTASGEDDSLAKKIKKFVAQIERWRTIVRRGHLADLLWQIYRQTSYLSFVSALPGGSRRRANLLLLHDKAIEFENFNSNSTAVSLGRFVDFVEKLQESRQDWTPAEPEDTAENAVRILSVHKSKGLEFGVVFLAELDGRFNKKDIADDCLVDSDYMLGLQIIDSQSNVKLSSLEHQVIAERKVSRGLAEEMRILYVATTRARERLILTASQKKQKCRDIVFGGASFGEQPIPDWQLRSCQSHFEWILYGLSEQKNLQKAFDLNQAAEVDNDNLLSVYVYEQSKLEKLSGEIIRIKKNMSSRSSAKVESIQNPNVFKILEQLKKSINWQYGYMDATQLPAKQSVTQLTHYGDEYAKIDYTDLFAHEPVVTLSGNSTKFTTDSLSIGSATHLVIANLDLSGPVCADSVQQTIKKLVKQGDIDKTLAVKINDDAITAFFETQLGRRVLAIESEVRREWPFSLGMNVSELSFHSLVPGAAGNETVVIQGIIDMLVKTPEGLVVIDFKTDDIIAEQACQRAEIYKQQLKLYGKAAAAILKDKLAGKWIYFLKAGIAIEV